MVVETHGIAGSGQAPARSGAADPYRGRGDNLTYAMQDVIQYDRRMPCAARVRADHASDTDGAGT